MKTQLIKALTSWNEDPEGWDDSVRLDLFDGVCDAMVDRAIPDDLLYAAVEYLDETASILDEGQRPRIRVALESACSLERKQVAVRALVALAMLFPKANFIERLSEEASDCGSEGFSDAAIALVQLARGGDRAAGQALANILEDPLGDPETKGELRILAGKYFPFGCCVNKLTDC